MSLRFIDSFDHYTTLAHKYDSAFNNGTLQIAAGHARTGANGLRMTGGFTRVIKNLDAQGTWFLGFGINLESLSNLLELCCTYDGIAVAAQGYLRVQATTGKILLVRGDGTVLATSTLALVTGQYYFIEFKHVIANAGGVMEARVNGVVWATFTGDTQNTANATADMIVLGSISGQHTEQKCDDFYVCDGQGAANNNYLGDIQVHCMLPDGAGNYTQFTPSAGSNFQNVDDAAPDDDTTYNSEATEGEADTYTFSDIPIATGTVHGIQIAIRARKESAGTASMQRRYRRSGTDNDGASFNPNTTYGTQLEIVEQDPIAAGAWTITNLNGSEFGVEAVA
jgi:hypothetical protein